MSAVAMGGKTSRGRSRQSQRLRSVPLLIALFISNAVSSQAQTSGAYQLRSTVISAGQSSASSGTQHLDATAGQPTVGRSVSGDYTLEIGFWPMIVTREPSPSCPGDCNADGRVTVGELVKIVNISLGRLALDACPAADGNDDGRIGITEIVQGVNHALRGCA